MTDLVAGYHIGTLPGFGDLKVDRDLSHRAESPGICPTVGEVLLNRTRRITLSVSVQPLLYPVDSKKACVLTPREINWGNKDQEWCLDHIILRGLCFTFRLCHCTKHIGFKQLPVICHTLMG